MRPTEDIRAAGRSGQARIRRIELSPVPVHSSVRAYRPFLRPQSDCVAGLGRGRPQMYTFRAQDRANVAGQCSHHRFRIRAPLPASGDHRELAGSVRPVSPTQSRQTTCRRLAGPDPVRPDRTRHTPWPIRRDNHAGANREPRTILNAARGSRRSGRSQAAERLASAPGRVPCQTGH